MNNSLDRRTGTILTTAVDVTSHESTSRYILSLVQREEPAFVCFATAHQLVVATRREDIRKAYETAALVNPDGMPLAWCLRVLGFHEAQCVSGPMQTPVLLRIAAAQGLRVGFYGGTQQTLQKLEAALASQYPDLEIAYLYSPPFRELTEDERSAVHASINAANVQLLFVGLGSVKQELWMLRNAPDLRCVCLGVGAVFEFLSGEKKLPSATMQGLGLAWLARLCQEPRRLARRNLYSPVFAAMFFTQVALSALRHGAALFSRGSLDVGRDAK
ncbi:WecB/TagA/CpsF family glycosyltransferase [Acidipila sp. EB88]|uniref:WecB/TagA/CpsF family glycosyltransferase n=1 Tax=Acidipila sp. EB88 TaxID=2305226 RepID=UPI000F5E52D4|nr:WecB/TagA/CpsF family glycosyltransferase [Acidipila sp. EB88]RRA49057.1 glycosyltransferase [Acidipila sp. EB88]